MNNVDWAYKDTEQRRRVWWGQCLLLVVKYFTYVSCVPFAEASSYYTEYHFHLHRFLIYSWLPLSTHTQCRIYPTEQRSMADTFCAAVRLVQ